MSSHLIRLQSLPKPPHQPLLPRLQLLNLCKKLLVHRRIEELVDPLHLLPRLIKSQHHHQLQVPLSDRALGVHLAVQRAPPCFDIVGNCLGSYLRYINFTA